MTIKEEFAKLLDANEKEEVYQQYLEKHTELIPCGPFLLNHFTHFSLIFSKMSIDCMYKSDFFFISKSSAEWNLIFVELEKPSCKLFNKEGTYSQELNKAIKQVDDWQAYFLNNNNKESFKSHPVIKKITSAVPVLYGNPFNFKFILVIGRRQELNDKDLYKRWAALNITNRDRYIMTYDSLVENLREKSEKYLCHISKDNIIIDNEKLIDSQFFECTDCNNTRIKQKLYDSLYNKSQNFKGLLERGLLGIDTNEKLKRLKDNIIS